MDENKKISESKLKKINGRGYFRNEEQEKAYFSDIHYGCGGHIRNHGNPFKKCECEKCKVKHYWYDDFFDFLPTGEGPYF